MTDQQRSPRDSPRPNPAALVKACGDPLGLHRARRESPVLPLDVFAPINRRGRRPIRHAWCPECRNAWHREYARRRYRVDAAFCAHTDARNRRNAQARKRERQQDRRFRAAWAHGFVVDLRAHGWTWRRIETAAGLTHDVVSGMIRHDRTPKAATFRALWELARTLEWEQERGEEG